MRRTLLLLLAVAGCKSRPHDDAPAPSASSAPSASPPVAVAVDAGAPAPSPSASAAVGADARKAYLAALGEGRKRTSEKKLDLAVSAFTRALAAIPGDARALAERGYARFLAGDLARAKDDFEFARAACDPGDKKLLAQIEYNLGLVCEASSAANASGTFRCDAAGHFRRSNDLSPTKAAKSKMAGCPISWGTPNVDVAPSLADGKKKWGAPGDEWGALDDATPGILVHADSDGGGTDVLLPLDAARYARVEVGSTSAWRCGALGEVSVTKIGDLYKVVYQAHVGVADVGMCMCDEESCATDYSANRGDPPCKCDTPVCMSGCGSADRPSGAHIETFVNARTGAGVWRTEIDEAYATQVQADTNLETMRFTASGLGCVTDVAIAKK